MDLSSASFTSTHPPETERLARMFTPYCSSGATVLLNGPIGAGKSLFARALISALLDEPEDIPSPTFTLVQVYQTKKFEIWHSDLYRISDPYDVIELGLDDAFESAFCIIEWPDRLGGFTPQSTISVDLESLDNDDHRRILLSSESKHWLPLIGDINALQ